MAHGIVKAYFYFAFALLLSLSASATCHAVGPTSSGTATGTSWTNRMTLPTTPTRGDTYYLMDGSYGSFTLTHPAGTSIINIKKAQSYDFGRSSDGCSNDISSGWNTATMGSAQAVFSGTGSAFTEDNFNIGFVTLDGNGQTTTPGCGVSGAVNAAASDCGIKLAVTAQTSDFAALWISPNYDNGVTTAPNWTVRYVEMQGGGTAGTLISGENEHTFYCRNGCPNLLFEHNYVHDSSCDFDKSPFGSNITYRYNHWKTNFSSANCHGQMWLADGTFSNVTWNDNIIQDVQGTAVWSVLNGGHGTNMFIYNNVIFGTTGTNNFDTSNALLSIINPGSVAVGLFFYGNTVIHSRPDFHGSGVTDDSGSGSSVTFENNLYYDCVSQQGGVCVNFNIAVGSTITRDFNSYLNVSGLDSQGSHDQLLTSGATNPFVNWTGYNFTLTSQLSDTNGSGSFNGATLSSPFNVDLAGISRPDGSGRWNRGALEFVSGTPQAAAPTFSPVAGSYIGSQSVTITSSSGGAIICYNSTGSPVTNGTTGCTTGTLYSGPVSVSVNSTLFAVAGGTGFTDSTVASANYNFTIAPQNGVGSSLSAISH